MRVFVVPRQRTVTKTETEIDEGPGNQVKWIPKGISGKGTILKIQL